jgi:uncharacterized protein (DUF433 family)
MSRMPEPFSPPIRRDESGAFRVGDSRVLLELVVRAFQDGATPEAIVQRYPTVTLADVYGVIAYYLRDQAAVEEYLAERERLADEVRARVAPPAGDLAAVRARLQARRARPA